MATGATVGDDGLSVGDWRRIDAACDRFEADWAAGRRPDLTTALADVPPEARARLFRELLDLELEFRRRGGERPEAVEYRERFADHLDAIDSAFGDLGPDDGGGLRTLRGRDSGAAPSRPRAALGPATIEALRGLGYEVVEELGRGGMGVVYLARKVALNRLCALKMILAGAHAGTAAAARFRSEAEAVARLSHPGIVQIYHVGEADGLPFLELEYLRGGSLDRVLDGTPRPADDAAKLVASLAEAIDAAHARGVVHRDLKPANILLDKDGAPKVADFGLAKVLDSDADLTRSQAVLGSPSYMAPEQAEGRAHQIGPTADVYALGAVLYELLTGRPPFKAATVLETLAQVKSLDPVPPSRTQPGLSRDLETICLKCLEKPPARRYATAGALAADLRRFLRAEPILARPTPPWEWAWKWARRRPTTAAALAVGAAAVALMFLGVLYYNARLHRAIRNAEDARTAALEERDLARATLERVVRGLGERLDETPATRPLRKDLLDAALAGFDELARRGEATTAVVSRALAHQKMGDILRQVGRSDEARAQYDAALRLVEGPAAANPADPAAMACLRRVCFGVGELDITSHDLAAAVRLFARAVQLSEALAAAAPRKAEARRELLEAYFQLGRAYAFTGDFAQADRWFRRMQDGAGRWVADAPDNATARDLLAVSYRKLADDRKLLRDFESARAIYLEAVRLGRECAAAEPANPLFRAHLATALDDLGGLVHDRGDRAGAEPLLAEAEGLFGAIVRADPDDVDDELRLIRTQHRLGRLRRERGRLDEAAATFRQALDRLLRLERAGRLEGHFAYKTTIMESLRKEVGR